MLLQSINQTFLSHTGMTTNAPGLVHAEAKTQIKVLRCATTNRRPDQSILLRKILMQLTQSIFFLFTDIFTN